MRGKDGRLHPLRANAAQAKFERRRGAGNIVLKARQMGMTTWVAGAVSAEDDHQAGDFDLAGSAYAGVGGGDS